MPRHRTPALVVVVVAAGATGIVATPAAFAFGPVAREARAQVWVFPPGGPPRTDPVPPGRTIETADGDTIVINGDDRIRMVRRREGVVRMIVDMEQRRAIVITDHPPPGSKSPDGRADETFTFRELQGEWTLEPRWEGPAIVEEASSFESPRAMGMAAVSVSSARGLVKFVAYIPGPSTGHPAMDDDGAVAVLRYHEAGRGGIGGTATMDEAEAQQRELLKRTPSGPVGRGPGGGAWVELEATTPGAPDGTRGLAGGALGAVPGEPFPPPPAPNGAPVRVGGNVASPRKIHDAAPVPPPAALEAGVTGVVIVEITIAADGTVSDARVLRSIPLLDDAALEAVRQWKYTPTLLNGQPVPVIMTVTVSLPG